MKKHLEFYKACMETGVLPKEIYGGGLCNCANEELIDTDLLDDLHPTDEDFDKLMDEHKNRCYWGSDLNSVEYLNTLSHSFTPLRQTIVLFMAAMNNEL